MKYYFCEYIILFLTWFKVFLVEGNLFQVCSVAVRPNYPSDYYTSNRKFYHILMLKCDSKLNISLYLVTGGLLQIAADVINYHLPYSEEAPRLVKGAKCQVCQ